jgi:nitrogen regulatory protein P-II 1
MLKVCVRDEDLDKAVDTIVSNARTGEVGDGKLFIYPVQRTIRIRTGEENNDAL